MRSLLLLLFLGCSTPAPPQLSSTSAAVFADAETEEFAIAAALLDPRCYTLAGTTAGGLDLTVPAGHAWSVTNAFAVYYGDPIDVAQDLYPNTRRSGFIRPLDARRALTIGAGTRVRSNTGINTAYLLYCDPAAVWDVDARYTTDPRALYYERLQRLRSIPTASLILEATGGGALTDDIHATLPAAPLLVTSASIYDASWVTVGCPDWAAPANVLSEINNSHGVRFAESILQPLPGCGARVVLQKGSNADEPHSTDPAIAYPIHGSGSLTYQLLPVDW